ncbi:MAG: exosome complex protein Rrp42 [Thermoplasmata archaeon]|nr:exosome complex protein Rrp42 [Thermoplasmata archaeon]
MTSNPLSDIMREHICKLISKDQRQDDRTREEFRPLTITTGYVSSAEGSALVSLGNTKVLVGIKSIVGEPFSDTPDKGVLTTNAELKPLASENFESGPPDEESIEIARVVDRGLREGKAVDLEKLCITPGEEVWINFVDIHALDYDGNLFDAANIAAVAALRSAMIPASRFEKGEDTHFPMVHLPISATFAKIDGYLIADPCVDEENVASARLTVVTLENGNLCAMQKGLGGSFTKQEIEKAIELSVRWGQKIRSEHFSEGD